MLGWLRRRRAAAPAPAAQAPVVVRVRVHVSGKVMDDIPLHEGDTLDLTGHRMRGVVVRHQPGVVLDLYLHTLPQAPRRPMRRDDGAPGNVQGH